MEHFELEDGAGGWMNVTHDKDYFSILSVENHRYACIVLSLEQMRELAGWVRQAMAQMKGEL